MILWVGAAGGRHRGSYDELQTELESESYVQNLDSSVTVAFQKIMAMLTIWNIDLNSLLIADDLVMDQISKIDRLSDEKSTFTVGLKFYVDAGEPLNPSGVNPFLKFPPEFAFSRSLIHN